MLKRTLGTNEAIDLLLADQYADWSAQGAREMVLWLEDFSDDLGEDIDFDVVAIRCEWSELSEDELLDSYGYLVDDGETEDALNDLIEYLADHTQIRIFERWVKGQESDSMLSRRTETAFLVREF